MVYKLFLDFRLSNKKLFKFPDDMAGQSNVMWPTISEPDSMVMDLRTTDERKDARESKSNNTFK